MDWLSFLIIGLGIYRLSRMLTLERGPFDLFESFRGAAVSRWGLKSWQGEGVSCPLCVSFWVSLAVAALCYFFLNLGLLNAVIDWWAWSAITVILYKQERE